MTRLDWAAVGDRFYETGVDRGVLCVDGVVVPWSGIVSVAENASGGEVKTYLQDGNVYLQTSSPERFSATLTAFYSPKEFDACDGMAFLTQGFIATQQTRKPFDLSYRTGIGNDLDGTDHSYKIHLIYDAIASPSLRSYSTIADSPSVGTLSWTLTAKPKDLPNGLLPSAHFIIDASTTYPGAIEAIEDILYGTDTEAPRIPEPHEIMDILALFDDFTLVDNGDGSFTITGPEEYVSMVDADEFQIAWPYTYIESPSSYIIDTV